MKYVSALFITVFGLVILLSGTSWSYEKGDRVLGQWSDGMWYPARIAEVKGDKFQINFDDGDIATLPSGKLKQINWKIGTKLQCNWKNRGRYYPGKITSMKGEAVHISYQDGDQEDITISRCRSK